jgi:PAS domain S-box-containing protein
MTVTVDGDLGTAYARLPALPTSVGEARRLVRRALQDHGRTDMVPTAELVVSEAVTNALVHAGTAIEVTVLFPEGRVRLEVGDGSAHLPMPRSYASTAGTGRGLMLIDGLTSAWGTVPHAEGKTVWFELDGSRGPATAATEVSGPGLPARPAAAGPALLGHGGRGDPSEARPITVQLVEFPVLLYIAWREYAEALLREFLLAGLDEDDDEAAVRLHAESSQALALLAEHVSTPHVADDPEQVIADAAAPGISTVTIPLRCPPDCQSLFATLDSTLDAAGLMSELAIFLTAPVQPEMRQFRRWLCSQVTGQAQGLPAVPWSPHQYASVRPPRASHPVAWDLARVTRAREALVAADDTDGIVAASDSAAALLGYDGPAELVGQRLVSVIPERYRQAHVAGFTLHLINGRSPLLHTPVTVPLRRRDGSETTASMTISAHHADDGREVFVAALNPARGSRPSADR